MNPKEIKQQILKDIVNNKPERVVEGLNSLVAEIERLRVDNKRLSEQIDDLKMDIGYLRGEDK